MLSHYLPLILLMFKATSSSVKKFMFDNDLRQPHNWVGHEKAKNCKGLVFTQNFHNVFIDNLKVGQVILPEHGSLYISNLEIDERLSKICIKVGALEYHSYYDPSSWSGTANKATPSVERIPCRFDDVHFPHGLSSAVIFDDKIDLYMKSLTIGGQLVSDPYRFQEFLRKGQWPTTGYDVPEVHFVGDSCGQMEDCLCHDWDRQEMICGYVETYAAKDDGNCYDPINPPIGECSVKRFCGGVVHVRPNEGFRMGDLKRKLEPYYGEYEGVDIHVSRVATGRYTEMIQVVFAEEEYSGKSAKAALEFYSAIQEDFKHFEPKVFASGQPSGGGAVIATIILCSFLAVFLLFASLYVYYVGTFKLPPSFTTPSFVFSGVRYDNKDEERLVYEGQSMAGSILSLDKAFENPMYGSSSTSTTPTTEQKVEPMHENPMYEIAEKEDLDKIESLDSEM